MIMVIVTVTISLLSSLFDGTNFNSLITIKMRKIILQTNWTLCYNNHLHHASVYLPFIKGWSNKQEECSFLLCVGVTITLD